MESAYMNLMFLCTVYIVMFYDDVQIKSIESQSKS